MADKKNTNKKEKKKLSPKILIIIGAAVAALALALFLIFNDGLPKNVKEGIEATVQTKFGCEIESLKAQKKFKVADSEYDKETIYLVRGVLKGSNIYADGYTALFLVAEIEDNGEEKVICKIVTMNPDKAVIKEKINELKKDPASWSAEIERQNEYLI